MPQERRTYTSEFKQEAVRLATESTKSPSQIARDLGIDPAVVEQERDIFKKALAIFSKEQR